MYTLVVINVLLFMLYACVMLVNARVLGFSRGARWFAGSNLSRGAAMLLVLLGSSLPISPRVPEAVGAMLATAGQVMLYLSFTDLLERRLPLRWVQYGLSGLLALELAYLLIAHAPYPVGLFLTTVTLGVQGALIASVVFRFSGEDVKFAGWLTGVALSLYALIMLTWAMTMLRHGTPGYSETEANMKQIWQIETLLTNGAVAFGFMYLSAAKLRVELLWRAQVDELTGLLNRWALKRVAVKEILRCGRGSGSLAVVMIDLDGLKGVNDQMGHGCGDVVLQAVASALQETVRAQDFVARMGGDEFCVLLPDTDLKEAVTVAERLRTEVHDLAIRFRGETVSIKTSLGVAAAEICGMTWQSLMDESDAALYRAKREGKNRVVVARTD